jgi:hypothetical protein
VPNTVNVATKEVDVTGGVITIGLLFKLGDPEKPTGNVHTYVAAPPAVKVVVAGELLKFWEHKVLFPITDTVGSPITDTCIVAKFVHVACEPMIEYVVVTVGLAVVFAPIVVVRAIFGLHEYVVAPLAVKLMELFKQINAGFGLIVTVGFATTVTTPFCDWELHPKLVPITEYTVVFAGFAITTGPVLVFKFVVGLQVNVEALLAFNVACVPAHILADVTAIVGLGYTVTWYTAELVQEPAVPNTVNVATTEVEVTGGVITSGLLFKLGLPEKPAGNVHTYVAAPPAVKVVVAGELLKFWEHKVLLPITETVGKPITDTCIVARLVHVACEPMIE